MSENEVSILQLDGKKNPERRKWTEETGEIMIAVGETGDVSVPALEYEKTSTIWAIQLQRDFEVDTIEGVMKGKPGDWLALGQSGELYPIDAAVFAVTYRKKARGQ